MDGNRFGKGTCAPGRPPETEITFAGQEQAAVVVFLKCFNARASVDVTGNRLYFGAD